MVMPFLNVAVDQTLAYQAGPTLKRVRVLLVAENPLQLGDSSHLSYINLTLPMRGHAYCRKSCRARRTMIGVGTEYTSRLPYLIGGGRNSQHFQPWLSLN